MVELKMLRPRIYALCFLALFSSSLLVQVGVSQEGLAESTTYQIAVDGAGSATWVIERRFILSTEEEVAIFQSYISEFESQKQAYLEEFSNETKVLVERGSLITGRSMRAENFDVTIGLLETVTASYGVIKYQYDWVGFAKIEEERIAIGDVFEGGFYLYKEDTLIVKYPQEFGIQAVSPLPDDNRENEQALLWYGRRNFGGGEPTIILTTANVESGNILQNNLLPIFAVVLVVFLIFGAFWFLKKRKGKKRVVNGSLEKEKFEIKSDEDKVVELLHDVGGQIYQSMITKQLGCSKAKTSGLLKGMEKKGLVKRKKMGREVVVTLL